MVFNSLVYALFLPTVVGLHWAVRPPARRWLLLVASYIFYGAWDWRFLGLILLSTLVDYSVGRWLEVARSDRRRRALLVTSVVVNLGILGFFKYGDFFVESAASLLARVGLEPNPALLGIVLPVGISFYTFQTISYTVDVYRGEIRAERNLATFALFVAYFPQLVAGPIERATHLLPQLRSPRSRPDSETVHSALGLILLGLVKKVVIADGVAPIVNRGFADAGGLTAVSAWATMIAFAVQVYGDFSGYTDIARGTSRLLGVELRVNFRQPYLSRNLTEYWRRWHVSLSSWLQTYLYVPLGGNRYGRWRTYRNLMITMVLGGLWHGAAWTFVTWGAVHGLILGAERALGVQVDDSERVPTLRQWPAVAAAFTVWTLTLVPFRSASLGNAGEMLSAMFGAPINPISTESWAEVVMVGLALAAVVVIDVLHRLRPAGLVRAVRRPLAAPATSGALAGAALVALVTFSGSESSPFIYFQF
jgi:alginate O-acetyltransferase complex protein AlgI